jgi:hypothetical protein
MRDLPSKNNTRVKGVDSILAVFCSVVQLTIYSFGVQMYMYVQYVPVHLPLLILRVGLLWDHRMGDCITSIMRELLFTDSSHLWKC